LADPDRPILLDTDVVSLLMRGSLDPARSGLRAYDWCVSYITVGELAKGAEMARWNLRRWTDLADWLGHVVILPIDLRVSYVWGRLAGAAQRRGRPRPVNDMWIAAVALSNDIPVATRNIKDYSDFVEHHSLDLLNPQS
jgi:predicted nucleic acid-binding protein